MGWFETYIFREPKDITAWLARFFSTNNIVTQPSFVDQKEWERFENFLEKEDERQKEKE